MSTAECNVDVPEFDSGLNAILRWSLLVLCCERFAVGTPVFPSDQKTSISWFELIL